MTVDWHKSYKQVFVLKTKQQQNDVFYSPNLNNDKNKNTVHVW